MNRSRIASFLALVTIWVVVSSFESDLFAASLDSRVFTSGNSVFVVFPSGVYQYSSDTRSLRTLFLDQSVQRDTIFDAFENGDDLWLLAPYGLYDLTKSTGTIAKIPSLAPLTSGRVTADQDYVWIATNDSLRRFDKLGREWLSYRVGERGNSGSILGTFSSGDYVYCVYPDGANVFSTSDEKWRRDPLTSGTISATARMFLAKDALIFADGSHLYRYIFNSRAWDRADANQPILELSVADTNILYLTSSALYSYNTASSLNHHIDIRDFKNATSSAKVSDSLVVVSTAENIMQVNPAKLLIQYVYYPENAGTIAAEKVVVIGDFYVIFAAEAVHVYDTRNKAWETIDRKKTRAAQKVFTWNDDGAEVRYRRGYSSSLKGSVGEDLGIYRYGLDTSVLHRPLQAIDSVPTRDSANGPLVERPVYRKDSADLYLVKTPLPRVDLTQHTAFVGDRYLDLSFNNQNTDVIPQKSVLYRGAKTDVVQSAQVGQTTFEIPQSQTMPKATVYGAAAVIETPQSLATRDRKIARFSAGVGYSITRTVTKILTYNPTGFYKIAISANPRAADTLQIVPGSVSITIDGETVDSTLFSFAAIQGNASILFRPQAVIDPTSVIAVSYQIQTIPTHGPREFEWLPENNFGSMGYASALVSPTDWLSVRGSVVPTKPDSLHRLVGGSVPLEYRDNNIFIKAEPEAAYDVANKSGAGGLTLQSRFGPKTSLVLNGLTADQNFTTTDDLSQGFGNIRRKFNGRLSYDILKELPVSYYQSWVSAQGGTERQYEVTAGAHFPRFPFFDATLSRDQTNASVAVAAPVASTTDTASADTSRHDTTATAVLDTLVKKLNLQKDKLKLRLYETSSPYAEKFLHLSKLSYDISYTEYRSLDRDSNAAGGGRVVYAQAVLSPLHQLTFSGVGTYLANPSTESISRALSPAIQMQLLDLPPGVELDAAYSFALLRQNFQDSSTNSLSREVDLILRPGSWTKYLSWMSPRASISQDVSSAYASRDPGLGPILLGDESVSAKTLTRMVGLYLYPIDDIFFRNENTWSTKSVVGSDTTDFNTFNDLSWWFNGKRALWQTHWDMTMIEKKNEQHHTAYSRFDNVWQQWLNSNQGLYANYDVDASGHVVKAGPGVSVGINFMNRLFIKRIVTTHSVNLYWYQRNGVFSSDPEFDYNIIATLTFKPNIALSYNQNLTMSDEKDFRRWMVSAFQATLSLLVTF